MGWETVASIGGSLLSKAIGGMGGGGKSPTVSPQPVADTTDAQKKAKTARSALLATEGGVLGSELTPGQVGRSTILGN